MICPSCGEKTIVKAQVTKKPFISKHVVTASRWDECPMCGKIFNEVVKQDYDLNLGICDKGDD